VLRSRVRVSNEGGVKPAEIVAALTGRDTAPTDGLHHARLGVFAADGGDLLSSNPREGNVASAVAR
jgi:hypothetical protein